MSRRLTLVTGASSGIGAAFADVFASEGFDLVIASRRKDRLDAVAEGLERQHGVRVHVIQADLSQSDAVDRLCGDIIAQGLAIDALVNCAGYGVPGSYMKNAWERHEVFMKVLVEAPMKLTYRLLPGMIQRRYGRIVNVASLAGLMPAPGGHTLYAAAKAFMVKFSESLAAEVRSEGVHVTALCPGFTRSEFHDVTGTRERVKSLPGFLWMDADAVARLGYEAVMEGRTIEIPGRVNRAIVTLGRLLPRRILNYAARKTARGYRQT